MLATLPSAPSTTHFQGQNIDLHGLLMSTFTSFLYFFLQKKNYKNFPVVALVFQHKLILKFLCMGLFCLQNVFYTLEVWKITFCVYHIIYIFLVMYSENSLGHMGGKFSAKVE